MDELSPVKKALLEIRDLRARLERAESANKEPLAVIGIGCRFPGAAGPDGYWDLLSRGVDSVRKAPADRWDADALFDADSDAPGRIATRFGSFIDDVDCADPAFFGISPREAENMDPQQRILLEVSWEAFEHAGVALDSLRGSQTGVYIGIGTSDYLQLRARGESLERIDAYYTLGSVSHSVASGRLAYQYGFTGPTLSVDTACSSSLVALHLAFQALRQRECSLAIAGGIGLTLAPDNMVGLSRAHMLAPDGRCKAFDARADGFGRGEGCGIVVLKRLADAQADGDRVLAVVRGSAVNQDGRSTGLTVPNGPAQTAVIRAALTNAGVAARDVSYVEAHGTGTKLGDPIEVQALAAAYGESRTVADALLIGSVKTNIGHLESAAGIASFIKVVLALQHGEIPAQLHFATPNPHIAWSEMPIEVVTAQRAWPARPARIAGVSSFGFSGTNAHVVLEASPEHAALAQREPTPRTRHVLALSAKTPEALQILAARYGEALLTAGDDLASICYTANAGRSAFNERLAIVAADKVELREALANFAAGSDDPRLRRHSCGVDAPRVAFLFSGQGEQYVGMGRALYQSSPAYRAAFDRCDAIYSAERGSSLRAAIFDGDDGALDDTALAQPALFAVEYALAAAWAAWGVEPDWVMGHSLGEYTAACVAGVLDLEDALRLVIKRGALMSALPKGGAMAAVLAPEARVAAALGRYGADLALAAVNGPSSVVVAGAAAALQRFGAELEAEGITVRSLRVSHAFHSPLLEPMLADLENAAAAIRYREPKIGLISNLTGQPIRSARDIDGRYWRRHAREPVRFADGVRALESRAELFIEIGPHTTLTALARQSLDRQVVAVASLQRGRDEWDSATEALADVWSKGARIDWAQFYAAVPVRRVTLPTYPFARDRYWPEVEEPRGRKREPADVRWRRARVRAGRQAAQFPVGFDPASYGAKWQLLNEIAAAYTCRTLVELGAFARAETMLSVDDVLRVCSIASGQRRLVTRWLERLAADGVLERDGERFRAPAGFTPPSAAVIRALEQRARAELDDLKGIRDYVLNAATMLPAVITGRQSPVEGLFPNGSFAIANAIYGEWAAARYYNGIVAAAVDAVAGRGPLRILEIGAGTGATTEEVLATLDDADLEYWFTDVSELFLGIAQQRFASRTCLHFALLDIEKDIDAQGFVTQSFDVIVASNVVHTATDIGRVLRSVRGLLAPGGLLVLYESTAEPRWCDVTFGLLAGWQRYDRGDEKQSPLLSVDEWQPVLRDAGFIDATAFSMPPPFGSAFYQDVLLALNAGETAGQRTSIPETGARRSSSSSAPAAVGAPRAALDASVFALPADERFEAVLAYVREEVTQILRLDRKKVPPANARLMDLGFDSLMAVELRNRLEKALDLLNQLPATLIFDHPSIEAIARHVVSLKADEPAPRGAAPAAAPESAASVSSISALADLSDEDVEAMLLKKLERTSS